MTDAPADTAATGAIAGAIARAEAFSPFLRKLLAREEELVALMEEGRFDDAVARAVARLDEAHPDETLRTARRGIALAVAIADLAGLWPLEKVTRVLSNFADRALQFAIDCAFRERGLAPGGLVALALGKLGSRELNYSSDIDLIFLHDRETLAHKPHEDADTCAVRIVQRVRRLLSERTGDGYVLRVDLRLRPDPDNTMASLPVAAAGSYYRSQAVAWERAAFIRARAAAGDIALGEAFLEGISPFIWRRSLDYTALAEIREISHRIREHFAERLRFGPGFDLKRGRGGIREVEFFAQVYQLIFGGRHPELRRGATLDALTALAESGQVPQSEARTLADAYRVLRTFEHRIQMVNDQQTHSLPRDPEDCDRLAQLAGLDGRREMEALLAPHIHAVAELYDRLLSTGNEERGERVPHQRKAIEDWAGTTGLGAPQVAASLVETWRAGRYRSLRSEEALRTFEIVLPNLLASVGRGPHGRESLLRLDQMIRELPSGVLFWRLLAAHPALATTIARILGSTPLLADALAARPALIDILITPSLPLPDVGTALAELRQVTDGLQDEGVLDRVRMWTAERRFQIGVELINGRTTPLEAAATLAIMAEAAVALFAERLTEDMERLHGKVPGSELVVLALGRFGGGQLTTLSDLDLVLLFTGNFEQQSLGPRVIGASQWFNRLGQRLVSALTVPTAAGRLYEVDMRLRPSGNAGLLAISLDSFLRYQTTEAEVWETMALSRARAIVGSPEARAAAEQAIFRIVRHPHDRQHVLRQARITREHMLKYKPASGEFDVKLARGGLVDIEFIAQVRTLAADRSVPTSLKERLSVVAPELVEPAALLMSVLVMLRLMQPHGAYETPTGAGADTIATVCGFPDIGRLRAALASARKTVEKVWEETFGAS